MVHKGQPFLINPQSYRWLASSLSLWLAVAYLWLALFYPLMCSPFGFDSTYRPVTQGGLGLLEQTNPEPLTITSNASTNGAFLIDSYNHGAAFAFTLFSIIATPVVSWLDSTAPTRVISYIAVELHTQFHASPPDQPPRISPV